MYPVLPALTLTPSALLLGDRRGRQVVGEGHRVVLDLELRGRLAVEGRGLLRHVEVVAADDVVVTDVLRVRDEVVLGTAGADTTGDHQGLAVQVVVGPTVELVLRGDVVPGVGLDDLDDSHDRLGDDLADGRGLVQDVGLAVVRERAVGEVDVLTVDVQRRLHDGAVEVARAALPAVEQHGVERGAVEADAEVAAADVRAAGRDGDRADQSVGVVGDVDARGERGHGGSPSLEVKIFGGAIYQLRW